MSRFAIRNWHFIIVACLIITVIGVVSLVRMPVDLFPTINMPEVVVATFYNGMPPEEIETEITGRLERFFTLASGVEHMESRSLPGVSIIKIFFQPGTNADADVTEMSNLALADLRRLPPGTLPPVVLKFDASSLPVCLVTLKGEGLTETQLHDFGQFQIRNQIAVVPGATIPPPFGGRYRQIMVYIDPLKLEAYQLGPMDVVKAINQANLILPAGDVKIGPYDYYIYTNSQVPNMAALNQIPLKTVGTKFATVADVGKAEDASQIQYNIVRVDGQPSVYLPIMRQGGDTNTIAVVNGIRKMVGHLYGIPKQLIAKLVFDQSIFIKKAIETLIHEGAIGLILTGLMILIFLGSLRATSAVFLSIPLSALAAFIVLYMGGSSLNTMILAGLALAFSRLIDNSVIVLENIYRHMEMGASPEAAAAEGAAEVNLAVLAATLTTAVVFFPVTLLYGVSRYLFSALALSVVISLFASYFVALTVVPLFCAKLMKGVYHSDGESNPEAASTRMSRWQRFNASFNRNFNRMLGLYEVSVRRSLTRPARVVGGLSGVFILSLAIFPFLGLSFFPRTDAGQFVINLKAPTGTRIEMTQEYVKRVEDLIRQVVDPRDLKMVVSNIGVTPGFSSLYTSNSGSHTATIQVSLNEDHHIGSYEYMSRVRSAIATQLPELRVFFQSGALVDAVLNSGAPAPIDVQFSGSSYHQIYRLAQDFAQRIRRLPGIGQVYIPQDLNYPAIRLNVDRVHASELGLSQKDVVDNVITALTSNSMIAPNYWVDPKTGNDYFLTVQYFEHSHNAISNILDLSQIPLHSPNLTKPTMLDSVAKLQFIETPTEVNHYQIQRVIDVFVSPAGEDLGRPSAEISRIIAQTKLPKGVQVNLRGMVQGMRESFRSFAVGLILSVVLLYLILVAQFRSFIDPLLIMLAIPMGFIGVLIILLVTNTTLNVMSLMGVLMLVGIATSNSILIVEFAHHLEKDGFSVGDAVITACRVRLRPILMTSLATVIGMVPMALKLGTGSEQYAPLARAIIGGLIVSVLLTVFIVPATYKLTYGKEKNLIKPDAEVELEELEDK